MPEDKNPEIRRQVIDRMLGNKFAKFPTKDDLRQECEEVLYGSRTGKQIHPSSIEKDMKFMKDSLDAPIKWNPLEKGYYYEEEGYSIGLTADEFESIHMASRVLDQLKDTDIFADFDGVVEKILERINLSYDNRIKDKREYIQFESAPLVLGTEYLNDLLHAIKNKKSIIIEYRKYSSAIITERKLDPYLLKEYRNRWYVIGWDHSNNMIKTFALDRVNAVEVSVQGFEVNSRFNLYKFYRNNIGITTVQEDPQRIVIETSLAQADYLINQPIHISQKEFDRNDEKVSFELNVVITVEVVMLLLGMGKEVKVLEPASLVGEMKGIINEMLNKYK
jgi:predicted DNA-binding transcriptional regulator YafY